MYFTSHPEYCQRLRVLFGTFCYLSAVTLGGGLAMLPPMREQFVTRRGWMTDDEMVDTVAAMQSMPGIIASNMGALIGYRIAGIPGAVSAVLGGLLPPFAVIVALASIVASLQQYAVVQQIFAGVRSAVSALILLAVFSLSRKIFSGRASARCFAAAVALASFVSLLYFEVNAVWVVIAGAVLGLCTLGTGHGGEAERQCR